MARTKQTTRKSVSGRAPTQLPAPKKGSIEWQLSEAQRLAAAKEAKLTAELHALRKSIDEDRKVQQAKFELEMQQRIKMIEETQAREMARAAEVVTPMSDAAAFESPASEESSAAASSSSSSAAAASVAAASTADTPISHVHDLTLPAHWPATQSHHVTLETLARDHPDFTMVERMMHTTGMPQAGVLQVQRIYNRPLWDRYVQARARIMTKIGNEHLNNPESMGNEKLMFHGSRHNAPSLIYANAEGFDVRMAGQGMLGPGLYFSDTAGYSGVSYAHPLAPQTWGPTAGKKYTAAIPPLLQANPDGTLKAGKIPKGAYQMFLARVCLGTGFDPSKHGGRPHQGYTARAPLRPFHCTGCSKEVDLEALNVALLRASVMRTPEKTTGTATVEEFEEEDAAAPVVVSGSARKRKRGTAAPANKKTKTQAAATPAATVGVAAVPAAAAAPVLAPAPAPLVALGPQPAPIVLRKSARHAVAGAPAPVFTPPRKKIRARRNAPAAVVVAPPTPLQLAPTQAPQQQQQPQQQPQQQAQQPQLVVPVVPQLLAVPAVMPPAPVASAAPAAPVVHPAVALPAPAASPDDGTITMTDAPDLEAAPTLEDSPATSAAAAASASPASPASPVATPRSFDSTPVCCPNPKCGQVLGTRGSLLAHPYRFDSVTQGHMSVTYESAASYPELLITYTANR